MYTLQLWMESLPVDSVTMGVPSAATEPSTSDVMDSSNNEADEARETV